MRPEKVRETVVAREVLTKLRRVVVCMGRNFLGSVKGLTGRLGACQTFFCELDKNFSGIGRDDGS